MSDFAGTKKPARTDEKALKQPMPVVPIGPGAAGVAAPAVLAQSDPIADLLEDAAAPADTAEPHAHPHDGRAKDDDEPGVFVSIADVVRSLLGRDKGN